MGGFSLSIFLNVYPGKLVYRFLFRLEFSADTQGSSSSNLSKFDTSRSDFTLRENTTQHETIFFFVFLQNNTYLWDIRWDFLAKFLPLYALEKWVCFNFLNSVDSESIGGIVDELLNEIFSSLG